MICDSCGEAITICDLEGEVTCDVCGVVQNISQTVVEGFSGAYTQTHRAGRVAYSQAEVVDIPEKYIPADKYEGSKDFQLLVGIQMVIEFLCKTLVNTFAFTNQVEIEAKEIWSKYLHFIVDNDIPINTMFNYPLPKGHSYIVSPEYIKNTRQIPGDADLTSLPKRLQEVISEMGTTSFEYVSLFALRFINDSIGGKRERIENCYDYSDIDGYISHKDWNMIVESSKGMKLPRSRKCSPLGFPLYIIEDMLAARRIPKVPNISDVTRFLEDSNPFRLCYMMDSVYRYDFVWRLCFSFRNIQPDDHLTTMLFQCNINDEITSAIDAFDPMLINKYPLELNLLVNICKGLDIHVGELNLKARLVNRVRMDLVNKIFSRLMENYMNKPSENLIDKSPLMAPMIDLQLACAILFISLIKCRYGIVANDIVRWIIQGRLPLKSIVNLLPAWILRAAHRQGRFAPRNNYARSEQEEMAYNLFTHTNAPHSAARLEITTAKLIACGLFQPVVDPSNLIGLKLNPYALTRRIVHCMRLPVVVLTVSDVLLDFVQDRGTKKSNKRQVLLYGSIFSNFPTHVTVAAVVLIACRFLWPIFHIQPPAFPKKSDDVSPAHNPTGVPRECESNNADTFENITEVNGSVSFAGGIDKQDIVMHEREIVGDPYDTPVPRVKCYKTVKLYERFDNLIYFDTVSMCWVVKIVNYEDKWNILKSLNLDKVFSKNGTMDIGINEIMERALEANKDYYKDISKPVPAEVRYQALCNLMMDQREHPNGIKAPDNIIVDGQYKICRFFTSRSSFTQSAVDAVLWFLHYNPMAASLALTSYYIPNDMNELKRLILEGAYRKNTHKFLNAILHRYTNDKNISLFTRNLHKWIKTVDTNNDYWLNFIGCWSGSISRPIENFFTSGKHALQTVAQFPADKPASYLTLVEGNTQELATDTGYTSSTSSKLSEVKVEDSQDESTEDVNVYQRYKSYLNSLMEERVRNITHGLDALKDRINGEDVIIDRLRCISPTNLEVYYTIVQNFNNNPYYSSWSLEKSLEYDYYKCLVEDQRKQVIQSACETLNTKVCLEQNDFWIDFIDKFEKLKLSEDDDEDADDRSLNEDSSLMNRTGNREVPLYSGILSDMECSFQEMGPITTHGMTLVNPLQLPGKFHGGLPVLYVLLLRSISNFIGASHLNVHTCTCDIESILIKEFDQGK